MNKTKADSPPISRKQASQKRKEEKKKARDREYYLKNRERKIEQVKKQRQDKRDLFKQQTRTRNDLKRRELKDKVKERRQAAVEESQRRREKIREQTRERVRKYREQKQQEGLVQTQDKDGGFPNRTSKKRATDKVKGKLPATPIKKADIIQNLVGSPRTRKILANRGVLRTPEEERDVNTLKALASDISTGINEVKKSGSLEKRAAFRAFKSLAFGDSVKKSRAKKSLGKLINLNDRSISKAIKTREEILKDDKASWLYIKRKVRKDALSEENKKKIFNYWSNTASRPTGDKKDFTKKRIGKKEYIRHAKHVLEKTQTEAYQEFKELHPEVTVKQRKFESLKPFFVKQARERDRKSCLCRKHVEAKIVFGTCLKFRKETLKNREISTDDDSIIWTSLTEVAEKTLCPKQEGNTYHPIKCLERQCESCGVDKLELLPEEILQEGTVRWSRYEYIPTGKFLSNGQEKKKISLVPRETSPCELFEFFKELLRDYPYHTFMARWQREQMDSLLENLPIGHAVCVHDYSEGYSCRQQDEIQSEYFDVAKVSLHVTILYRHAVEAFDDECSTEEKPNIIKEHMFVISDDTVQDQDSVHKVQQLVQGYLNQINYDVKKMHEFTDGCAAQYKSRHCVGDVSCSLADFGFPIQRNYFETSHAKGEQDAAGSHVKQKISKAVLNRTATINSAKAMYEYLEANFTQPTSTFTARANAVHLRRRVFFHVPSEGENAVARNREGRKFKEVKGIRKWHCVKSLAQQEQVSIRYRSCYCISCIADDESHCTNKAWLDDWKEVNIARDGSVATTRQAREENILDYDTASHIADLATNGSTVAIAADDDPMYDFYLLKVTSEGVEELESNFTDDYQVTALRGEQVLKGNFYLRDNIHDMTFTLDTKHTAVVYAATVRHICGELTVKKKGRKMIHKLPLRENEEIIASL